MHACIHIYIYIYIHIYICIYKYMCVVCMYVRTYVHLFSFYDHCCLGGSRLAWLGGVKKGLVLAATTKSWQHLNKERFYKCFRVLNETSTLWHAVAMPDFRRAATRSDKELAIQNPDITLESWRPGRLKELF